MSLLRRLQLLALIVCTLRAHFIDGKPNDKLSQEPGEAAKVFDKFPKVVAIFDVDKDGELECLTAVRTDYDMAAHSAKYVWILKGLHGHKPRNETFLVIPGMKQGEFLFKDVDTICGCDVVDIDGACQDLGDGPLQIGNYDYTDYKNCVVMRMPYHSWQECVLWVTEEAKDNVPRNCLDHFKDSCKDAKLAYDKETCGGIHT